MTSRRKLLLIFTTASFTLVGVAVWRLVDHHSGVDNPELKQKKNPQFGKYHEGARNAAPASPEEWKRFVASMDGEIDSLLATRLRDGIASDPRLSLSNLSQVLSIETEYEKAFALLLKQRLVTPLAILDYIRNLTNKELAAALSRVLISHGTKGDAASAVAGLDCIGELIKTGQADAAAYKSAAEVLMTQLTKQSTLPFLQALIDASKLTQGQLSPPLRAHLRNLGPDVVFEAIKVCQRSKPMLNFLGNVLGESLSEQPAVTPAQLEALGRLDPESAAAASRTFFSVVIKQDPRLAAKYFTESGIATSNADNMHYSIAGSLAAVDAKSAADWVARLPAVSQPLAYERVMHEWVQQDPNAASEFLDGMSAGPSKDSAIGVLVNTISVSDPQSARAWAEQIADNQLRKDLLDKLNARRQ